MKMSTEPADVAGLVTATCFNLYVNSRGDTIESTGNAPSYSSYTVPPTSSDGFPSIRIISPVFK